MKGIKVVHKCLICKKKEVISTNANKLVICAKCRQIFLSQGILLVNIKTGRLVIVEDAAFEAMFPMIKIPDGRVYYVNDTTLDTFEDGNTRAVKHKV